MSDALVLTAFVIATVTLAIVLILIPVVAYVIWRYVYQPWRVMRNDIVALNQKYASLEQQARVKLMSDEEQARVEARINARQRARMGVQS